MSKIWEYPLPYKSEGSSAAHISSLKCYRAGGLKWQSKAKQKKFLRRRRLIASIPNMQYNAIIAIFSTLCLKKVPTFKLSVTLSNLDRFSKFLHCWKACEICYKTTQHHPPHLKDVATIPSDIKNSNFLQIFSRYGNTANKLHFQCTDFNSSTRVTVYAGCIYVFLSQSCPRHWMPCWLLTNTAVIATVFRESAVTNFRCHRLIVK